MNNHFNRLTTPLLSLPHYPTLRSQARRFLDAGYTEVETIDLNSFFHASMSTESREKALNTELFDEYEELNTFLCHYFVAVGRNVNSSAYFGIKSGGWQYIHWQKDVLLNGNMMPIVRCHRSETTGETWGLTRLDEEKSIRRRFAACCSTAECILIHGGLSNTTRLATLLTLCTDMDFVPPTGSPNNPSPRMCHTLTALGAGKSILIGGREAPRSAIGDAWVYDKEWKPVQNLPNGGLYRHAAVQIEEGKVIVFGGRHTSDISSTWLVYEEGKGWQDLKCDWSPALWGACLGWNGESGILVGGVDGGGECPGDIYTWYYDDSLSSIVLKRWDVSPQSQSLTSRFGAAIVARRTNDFVLVGGVGSHHLLPWSEQFVLLSPETEAVHLLDVRNAINLEPWLIGHNAVYDPKTDEILIIGGGGVCFSFGSFWNEKIFRLRSSFAHNPPQPWKLLEELPPLKRNSTAYEYSPQESTELRRVRMTTPEEWRDVLRSSKACVLEGLNFGPCISKWTPEYLKSAVGPEKQVIIHKTESEAMNFLSKNFKYTTKPFAEFVDAAFNSSTERVYLRAVSDDAKNKPTTLKDDFPSLAEDFEIPSILRGEDGIQEDKVFSTVLRLGSVGTSMWLHYDVHSSQNPTSRMLIVGHGEHSNANRRRKGNSHLPSINGKRS